MIDVRILILPNTSSLPGNKQEIEATHREINDI